MSRQPRISQRGSNVEELIKATRNLVYELKLGATNLRFSLQAKRVSKKDGNVALNFSGTDINALMKASAFLASCNMKVPYRLCVWYEFPEEAETSHEGDAPAAQVVLDFTGYSGVPFSVEEKSSQLLHALMKHFRVNRIELAEKVDYEEPRITWILEGRRSITRQLALKLMEVFSLSTAFRDELWEVVKKKQREQSRRRSPRTNSRPPRYRKP